MRVLYLTMNPNRESTTVPTEGWFRLLAGQGLAPVLISGRSGAFQRWAAEQGVPSYEVPLPFPDRRRPWRFLRSLASVVAIARRHRVQLVHCNEHDIYPIGQYAARLLGVPVVLSVHFTLRDGFSKWAFGGSRRPDRMFFVSKSSMDACRPDFVGVVDERRCAVLYNGIDMEKYQIDPALGREFRHKHGLNGYVVVGSASALRPRKQLEHLITVVSRLPASVKFVLAGGPVIGDESYSERLIQSGRELLGDRLIYLGHQTDLRPMLNGLDLFLNASQEESFGLTALEAMACGCPVVGYPSISVSEVVLPGGGEIVPQDAIGKLSDALRRWLCEPGALQAARLSARHRAASTFDIRKLAQQLWSEYEGVIGDGALR